MTRFVRRYRRVMTRRALALPGPIFVIDSEEVAEALAGAGL